MQSVKNDNTQVVVLVGMPGAGKSYCISHLETLGFPSVYFGGITIDEIGARGLEVNEINEKMVREDIRAKEGKDAYAKRIIAKIEKLANEGHRHVVADGLYSWTEYKVFKERFGEKAIIIAIAATRKVRHERLAHRPVRPLSDSEVTAREYAEIENIEKGGPIANADYTIVNDHTPEEMVATLDQILRTVSFI
jgi:dephospho-CoA kinase